jgi:hypothetical protein
MDQFLAKLYGSFIIAGQGANGGPDITSGDENFFTTMRALWNMQEICTDEAICGWGDVGIADLNTQTWSPNNPFLTALYQRLGLSITLANVFIDYNKDNTDEKIVRYTAEARFLRALAYYWAIDLFGQFPFTTEETTVGKFFPEIKSRTEIFNYVESELLEVKDLLGEPGFSYPQADKATAWMLLARLYLNAEVYTGEAMWAECEEYCDLVINSGQYSLAENYRQNFTADNNPPFNPEMIFAWEQDGLNTRGSLGTTFIIKSSSDPVYLPSGPLHGLFNNPDWNGNRARKDFLNVMVDTIATYGNVAIPATDTFFSTNPDTRIYMKHKLSINIPSSTSSGDYGVGVYKFTGYNLDGSEPVNYHRQYSCTDYPIFRLADAYLMRAESRHNLGDGPGAAADINIIRERAFGNTSRNISAGQVTDQVLLDERGREFYFEGHRRTDLVRFDKFTGGDYVWVWKGGVKDGIATSSHLDIYPLPGDEVSTNPNYNNQNNPGY